MNDELILKMKNITKSFSDNLVLNKVDFELRRGEVHSLMGANGAGKSTLVKILNGIYTANSGDIIINGEIANIKKSEDAERYGIAFVHQELNICPDLNVAENIFLGNLAKNKIRLFNNKETIQKAQELIDMIQVEMKSTDMVRNLRAAEKQIIEILKALTTNAKILVLDEPTSSLNEKEKDIFIGIVNKLKSQGVSIVFISHFLEDVLKISDRVTVIKDGVNNGVFNAKEISKDVLINAMMGKAAIKPMKREIYIDDATQVALELEGLCSKNKFNNINLQIKAGSVIGICGLLGAGKTEIARAVFGLDSYDSGRIKLFGEEITKATPEKMMKNKVALVTEDRKNEGFVPLLSIRENNTLSIIRRFTNKFGVIDRKKQKAFAENLADKMTVKKSSVEQNVVSLSGGNQQKVVISRCVASNPKIFMLDEPTRGVDVYAKSEIYKILLDMAAEEVTIIIFSSELEELLEVCDEIIILKKGEISGRIHTSETNKNELLSMIS
ncbi:MAG: sugar ABC transporter ATP-binding protein [Herbinix sp.]|nr:sugar ABC transporter ATP-binding protein [Herbinix sp.]